VNIYFGVQNIVCCIAPSSKHTELVFLERRYKHTYNRNAAGFAPHTNRLSVHCV